MKKFLKKAVCFCVAAVITALSLLPPQAARVSADESIGNGIILSTDVITVAENGIAAFTAALAEGFDASRLTCIVADPNVATVIPAAYVGNVAGFQVNFAGVGSTVVAVVHMDNPAIIAYAAINASSVTVQAPQKLGTNKKNYCTLVSYEFVPYDFKYGNFNDYKSTLKIKYKCTSYKDNDYKKWGCYGYFYDAAGNILGKVHLYCGALAEGRVYDSEFNVPVNAVRFAVEGFN